MKILDSLFVAVGSVLAVALVGVLIAVIIGFPVMWLWNWLMPTLFGLSAITFWQAVGLYILCNILFKNSPSEKKE